MSRADGGGDRRWNDRHVDARCGRTLALRERQRKRGHSKARYTTLSCVQMAVLASGAGLAIAVLSPPEVIPTLAPMVMENLARSGLGNPVAGVLFVYRALDTLLEKVVLILALLGVWSLAPDGVWGGIPGLRVYAQPSSTLTFLARLLPPVGIVVAIYMCWVGAKEPGGAFQGGTVLAAMWPCHDRRPGEVYL